jgi:hypothetical protein
MMAWVSIVSAIMCWAGVLVFRVTQHHIVGGVRRFDPRLRERLTRLHRGAEWAASGVLLAYTIYAALPPYPMFFTQVWIWASLLAGYVAIRMSRQAYEAAA